MERESRIRKRIPKACKRCHRRKQKCDQGVPSCSNCQAANQVCSRAESAPSWHHGMSKGALAHRIEILEARLAASLVGDAPDTVESSEKPPYSTSTSPLYTHKSRHGYTDGVLRFLTLGNTENREQAYLGPSSGLSIADAVGTHSLPINSNQHPDISPRRSENTRVVPPNDENGARIIEAYFTHMHVRLPFLDRAYILELHAKRYRAVGQTAKNEFDNFKLFMVYAIGATILQMTGSYNSIPPNEFLSAALSFETTMRESVSIDSIESIMLLVLYNLRSSSHPSVWYLIGLAMRTCIDFGFHRESRYQKLPKCEAERQRRLFWSVYLIERHTAWALGRPFSISEEEIDAQPPLDIGDSTINDDATVQELQPEIGQDIPNRTDSMSKFAVSVRLQRIVSQIHTRIYRVDKKASNLLPEIGPLMSALNDFKEKLPSLGLNDSDFVLMHWNNSIRVLLQPFLSILDPSDNLFVICITSSGQMCQFFKRLRQREFSGYSFLLANSVFIAGLTMCFCLFRSPRLWSPIVSDDLRACSSSLFVMAERNPRLRKHRDGLEVIISKAMRYVEEVAKMGTANPPVTNQDIPIYQHIHSTPDIHHPMGIFGEREPSQHPGTQPDSSASEIDCYMTSLLSDIRGFPFHFQNEQCGTQIAEAPFESVLGEDFWPAGTFDQVLHDGFGWEL